MAFNLLLRTDSEWSEGNLRLVKCMHMLIQRAPCYHICLHIYEDNVSLLMSFSLLLRTDSEWNEGWYAIGEKYAHVYSTGQSIILLFGRVWQQFVGEETRNVFNLKIGYFQWYKLMPSGSD